MANQFKETLRNWIDLRDIERIIPIGLEALAKGILNTTEDGPELLHKLIFFEHEHHHNGRGNPSIRIIKDLFEILVKSGTPINGFYLGGTALTASIAYGASIVFNLLMAHPLIDLNILGQHKPEWTALITAICY